MIGPRCLWEETESSRFLKSILRETSTGLIDLFFVTGSRTTVFAWKSLFGFASCEVAIDALREPAGLGYSITEGSCFIGDKRF